MRRIALLHELILVTYYTQNLKELIELLDDYDLSTRRRHANVLVIDNAAKLATGLHRSVDRAIKVVHGTNEAWEFSAWAQGLQDEQYGTIGTLTLLNDTFGRNWNITFASRSLIHRMYRAAQGGKVAGWVDTFSRMPQFARRPNSRLVVLASEQRAVMAASVVDAIKRCQRHIELRQPLFSRVEEAQIRKWTALQAGRWGPKAVETRLQRMFIEHHLFDRVPPKLLSLFPETAAGTLVYGLVRRLVRERR